MLTDYLQEPKEGARCPFVDRPRRSPPPVRLPLLNGLCAAHPLVVAASTRSMSAG